MTNGTLIDHSGRAFASRISTALSLLLLSGSLLFSACDGDSSLTGPDARPAPAPGVKSPSPPPVWGTVDFHVFDEEDQPLTGVPIQVYVRGRSIPLAGEKSTDASGRVSVRAPAGETEVWVQVQFHGPYRATITVEEGATVSHRVRLLPSSPHTVALLPPTLLRTADAAELQIDLTILASGNPGFTPHSYDGAVPLLTFGDCWVDLDLSTRIPSCRYGGKATHGVSSYAYDEVGTPAMNAADPVTLLLVDQGFSAELADPHGHRWRGARYFARRFQQGTDGVLLAAAGFAGPATTGQAHAPLQLPPAGMGGAAALFTGDAETQLGMLDARLYPGGAATDTAAAILAGIRLLAVHAPAGSRSLVVLTGPLEREINDAEFDVLSGLREESGVNVVLVSLSLAPDTDSRRPLARLAAALQAPVIVAGYPTNWRDYSDLAGENGIVQAMGLAAGYLGGESLPSIRTSLILRDLTGTGFVTGTPIHDRAEIESDICPMGCGMLPLDFFAYVP